MAKESHLPTGRRTTQQTGRSGEYYVAAELSRRGFNATTFAGNLPDFDIVAVAPPTGKALYVQVKTSTSNGWQLDLRKGLKQPKPDMFWVLVHLRNNEPPRYWVIHSKEMRAIIQREYDSRPHQFDPIKPGGYHLRLPLKSVAHLEGGWERLLH